MDRISLKNYRCFGSEEQSARLAPLTLLVGPNSTGKTSFLALIRVLWDVAFREVVPNFKEEPYDLGSWDDIVYNPGGRAKLTERFAAGFGIPNTRRSNDSGQFLSIFANRKTAPYPLYRSIAKNEMMITISSCEETRQTAHIRILQREEPEEYEVETPSPRQEDILPFRSVVIGAGDEMAISDLLALRDLVGPQWPPAQRPFASAPVHSHPRRTYNPSLLAYDAEGDYIPSYLANLSRRDADNWQLLKAGLEDFGKSSELFDEIQVRSFGKSDGDPFQIQVRKHSGPKSRRRKGPWRNLIDVGYGVSQALPVLTELLRPDGPTMFLLQQPEVHLHPQAQAALGTLFCQVAAGGRQLVIETHSDYIIDRVRMDVRDGTTGLKPEDVSILYFEPGDVAVKIHSIRMDKMGNVLDAPPSYGKFFMDEINRSIGLVKPNVRNS